jgi:amino acid transporter
MSSPPHLDKGASSSASARISEPKESDARTAGYGLRRGALSPMETLAQSIATVGPSLTPVATIPLVGALAGNGTWLAYVLATIAILFVAWCVSRFARYTSSPGSLYSYVTMILPPWLGAVAGWSLFLAYVATGASNMGGFYEYANVMLRSASGHMVSTVLLSTAMAAVTMWFAWREVKISARLMLSMEALCVTLIIVVVVLVLVRHGLNGDSEQLHLNGMTGSGLRLGLVLAIFSFVGFESATTLGAEARDPLKTIPKAVMRTAILGGFFFTVCAYTEVMGLRMDGKDLATSDMPMHVLASVSRVPVLGTLIDIGALVALFSGVLACIIAAARVLLLMAHNGLAHESLRSTHERNETPTAATVATGLATLIPVALLAARGANGLDVYGWLGSLATYGFIVTYGLVCFALPRYLRDHHSVVNTATKTVPWIGVIAMILALAGNLYPVPEGPYGKLPYIYLVYLFIVLMWSMVRSRLRAGAQEKRER